eukprot:8940451-Pyramimonas_sp.AAC.1
MVLGKPPRLWAAMFSEAFQNDRSQDNAKTTGTGCAGPLRSLQISIPNVNVSVGGPGVSTDDPWGGILGSGSVAPTGHSVPTQPLGSAAQFLTYEIPQVARMIVLGALFDTEFSEHEDIKHRLAAARENFWTARSFYESPLVPMTRKFKRYDNRVRRSSLFGIEGTICD